MNAPANNQEFKADGGKLLPSLLLEGMPRALLLIVAVLSYGAQKYEAHSWKRVEEYRYKDAKLRHMFDELAGLGITDPESGLLHLAHEACNILFLLEMKLMKLPADEFQQLLRFKAPPLDHKIAKAKIEQQIGFPLSAGTTSGND
ncbi:dATP/dGTP diphosphohydrolase domain-containing protein [Mesorhizobium sp.]|uniref:dATP/dGTP diphosphohydrolase domain-containing protein n=1 Tax=Mesorhizobium sp. TaxID=1871066 RepID=UPI0025E6359B|nr:dATP/dGTP diphosphohydrolase domain-containing protein [Mesorhizobium sp.]